MNTTQAPRTTLRSALVNLWTKRVKARFSRRISGLVLGHLSGSGDRVSVSDSELRQHMLLLGPTSPSSDSLLESVMTQQVARGGGLLVFDPTASARLPLVLQDALAVANRHDDFFSLHLEQQASPEFPITSIFANNQVGYVSLLPSPFGMQKRRANAVLTDLANNMRETRQQQQGLPPTVPFLLVLPRLSTWLDPVWTPFFSQARAFNIAILWQSDSITSVYKSGTFFANALMANSRLKLFLKDSFGQDYPSPVQGTELETEQALMERDGTYQKITLGQSG